jgi:hypothetical protein
MFVKDLGPEEESNICLVLQEQHQKVQGQIGSLAKGFPIVNMLQKLFVIY